MLSVWKVGVINYSTHTFYENLQFTVASISPTIYLLNLYNNQAIPIIKICWIIFLWPCNKRCDRSLSRFRLCKSLSAFTNNITECIVTCHSRLTNSCHYVSGNSWQKHAKEILSNGNFKVNNFSCRFVTLFKLNKLKDYGLNVSFLTNL